MNKCSISVVETYKQFRWDKKDKHTTGLLGRSKTSLTGSTTELAKVKFVDAGS
jgi:hypothetical protein